MIAAIVTACICAPQRQKGRVFWQHVYSLSFFHFLCQFGAGVRTVRTSCVRVCGCYKRAIYEHKWDGFTVAPCTESSRHKQTTNEFLLTGNVILCPCHRQCDYLLSRVCIVVHSINLCMNHHAHSICVSQHMWFTHINTTAALMNYISKWSIARTMKMLSKDKWTQK